MARLRFILVAAFVLVMGSCALLEQQENFISFTWDGMQYLFIASDDPSGHPYAVGYASAGQDPYEYRICASATPEDAAAGTNTIVIDIGADGDWGVNAYLYDEQGAESTRYLGTIPEDRIDNLIANRDVVGEQFAGSLPGPSQGSAPYLENIIFSVERLANIIPVD